MCLPPAVATRTGCPNARSSRWPPADLARRWHDLMDINAGHIADGQASIEDVGWELFHMMLEVASGRKQTWAEQWKLHNALVLFNPAPVT